MRIYIRKIAWAFAESAHIFAQNGGVGDRTNRTKLTKRLERDGWFARHDGGHDVYKHAEQPGRIVVPRHRELSIGVARNIAKVAGWIVKEEED